MGSNKSTVTFLDLDNTFHISSIIVSSEDAESVGFFDEGDDFFAVEDIDFYQKLLRKGIVFHKVESVLTGYMQNSAGSVQKDHLGHALRQAKVWDTIYDVDRRVENPASEFKNGLGHAQNLLQQHKLLLRSFIWNCLSEDDDNMQRISRLFSPLIMHGIPRNEIISNLIRIIQRFYKCKKADCSEYLKRHQKQLTEYFNKYIPFETPVEISIPDLKNNNNNNLKFIPINYTGSSIIVNKDNVIKGDIPNHDNVSFEIDFIFKSHETSLQASPYDDTYPPMPLLMGPISFYQIDSEHIRLLYKKAWDITCDIMPNSWHHIKLTYNSISDLMNLTVNNVNILQKSVPTMLPESFSIGCGHKNRFWNGAIGEFKIQTFVNNDKSVIVDIHPKKKANSNPSKIHNNDEMPNRKDMMLTKTPLNQIEELIGAALYFRITEDIKKIFVVGNGPSLRSFDFSKLNNIPWMGMNAAYRFWEKVNIYPDYYICLDTVVINSHKDNIYDIIKRRKELGVKVFILRRIISESYPDLEKIPEVIFIEDYFNSPYFDGIINHLTTGSFSVLFGAMLGFKDIYLLGIDLTYVELPEAKPREGYVLEMSKTPAKNPNYFFDDYQQKGDLYNIPDSTPNLHQRSWATVKKRVEDLGVSVRNCNRNSNLSMFAYAEIDDVLPDF